MKGEQEVLDSPSILSRRQAVTIAVIVAVLTGGLLLGPQSESTARAQDRAVHKRQESAWTPGAATDAIQPAVPIEVPVVPAQERAPSYTALSDLGAPWPEDGDAAAYTFVQLSDTHVGREDDGAMFARAVDAINALQPQPRFVIITGDLTEGFMVAEVAEFKATLARLKAPVHVVPGNHDEGFDPRGRAIRFFNLHFPADRTPYRFDEGGVAYIGIDSQLFNARRKSKEAADYADVQWAQMERLLEGAKADGKRIVMFHHIPFYPSWEPHRAARPMWKSQHREAYRGLLARFGVEAELTGHFHRDEFYMDQGTYLLNAPPISQKFGRRPSFRLFRVSEVGLTYRQVYFAHDAAGSMSYQLDLQHVSDAARQAWLVSLPSYDLRLLWQRRQAYDEDADPWFAVMDRESWRTFALAPLDFHEADRRSYTAELGAADRMRRQKKRGSN